MPSPTRPTHSGSTELSSQVVQGGGEGRGGEGVWHSAFTTTTPTGLWNHLFLVSNVCLLLLLPFGHFFMESEGFSWSRKVRTVANCAELQPRPPCVPLPFCQGLWSKVYESSVVVVLTVALLGLVAWVVYSLWQQGSSHYSGSTHGVGGAAANPTLWLLPYR